VHFCGDELVVLSQFASSAGSAVAWALVRLRGMFSASRAGGFVSSAELAEVFGSADQPEPSQDPADFFECAGCGRELPIELGAEDRDPDLCDECWAQEGNFW